MGNRLSLTVKLKKIFLDLISFDSPQAKVFNFSLILLIAAVIPTDKLGYLPIFSIYQTFFNMTFYSSGMTRGMSRLFHGDINGALTYNKLIIILVLVIFFLLVYNIIESVKYYKENKKIYKYF
jgi:hypothetical protein